MPEKVLHVNKFDDPIKQEYREKMKKQFRAEHNIVLKTEITTQLY